jgi:hypothetical protein
VDQVQVIQVYSRGKRVVEVIKDSASKSSSSKCSRRNRVVVVQVLKGKRAREGTSRCAREKVVK